MRTTRNKHIVERSVIIFSVALAGMLIFMAYRTSPKQLLIQRAQAYTGCGVYTTGTKTI